MYNIGNNNPNYKHGLKGTKEYIKWKSIKSRCFNKNLKQFDDYGGRGITMYEDWTHDAKSFIDYIKSLENYEKEGYTLDREKNDGNYEPGNLRWVDRTTQNTNQRIRKDNTSGHKGIRWYEPRKKWLLVHNYNGEHHHIGYFDTIEEAIKIKEKL